MVYPVGHGLLHPQLCFAVFLSRLSFPPLALGPFSLKFARPALLALWSMLSRTARPLCTQSRSFGISECMMKATQEREIA